MCIYIYIYIIYIYTQIIEIYHTCHIGCCITGFILAFLELGRSWRLLIAWLVFRRVVLQLEGRICNEHHLATTSADIYIYIYIYVHQTPNLKMGCGPTLVLKCLQWLCPLGSLYPEPLFRSLQLATLHHRPHTELLPQTHSRCSIGLEGLGFRVRGLGLGVQSAKP